MGTPSYPESLWSSYCKIRLISSLPLGRDWVSFIDPPAVPNTVPVSEQNPIKIWTNEPPVLDPFPSVSHTVIYIPIGARAWVPGSTRSHRINIVHLPGKSVLCLLSPIEKIIFLLKQAPDKENLINAMLVIMIKISGFKGFKFYTDHRLVMWPLRNFFYFSKHFRSCKMEVIMTVS